MLKLIIKQKGKVIQEVSLQNDVSYTIGRGKENQIVLPEQAGISRKHLELFLGEDQQWSVKNLSQTSQLIVNGEETDESAILEGGFFQIQDFEFILQEVKKNKSLIAKEEAPLSESKEKPAGNSNSSKEESPPDKTFNEHLPPSVSSNGKTQIIDIHSHAQQMCAYLKISYEEGTPRDILKLEGQSEWILGRDEAVDIVVDNANISREHFKINRDNDGQYHICDLKSSNGTILNNKDLKPNKPYPIQSGDTIYIMDIEILFEIKNLSLEKELAGLKAPTSPTPVQNPVPVVAPTGGAPPPAPPYITSPLPANMPGVVIEMPEEEQSFFKKNKKRLMMYGTVLIIIGAVYFLNTEKKEDNTEKKEMAQTGELAGLTPQQIQIIKDTYQLAQQLYSQGKFEYCKSEVKKIHSYIDSYLQSKKLGVECAQAAENQRIQTDLEQKRKKAEETEKNIQKITDKCDKEFDTFKFKHELVDCLENAIELSPADGRIQGLIERFDAIEMEKEEKKKQRAERKQFINSITSKYVYAKKLYTNGKILKAIDAYQRFINISNHKELKEKRALAKRELAAIKKDFNNRNNRLNRNCETKFNKGQFQKAYHTCERAADTIPEPHNKKALSLMNKSRQKLEIIMKPYYEEASLNESVGNIEIAQEYWKKILILDVNTGMYYKMAKEKMDRY